MVAAAPRTAEAPPQHLRRFLLMLWRPGDVRELRIPKHNQYGSTASGYFDDPEKLSQAVQRWDGKANLYLTLNTVNPALLARAFNRIVTRAEKTTSDDEVERRSWLFLDIDPVRPSGISSTDKELAAADEVLKQATAFLGEQGWPEPIVAMSGNGYYALYRIDLPNDDPSRDLVVGVLRALAERFNTERAKIDPTVANASRIVGLVGTKKMKGDPLPDRPHRRSCLEAVPDAVSVVSREQLEQVARLASNGSGAERQNGPAGARSLADLLRQHGIEFREQPADAQGVTWYHVRQCPFHDDGRPFECGVGQKLPDGPLAGKCFHPEGDGKGWQGWKRALGLVSVPSREATPQAKQPSDAAQPVRRAPAVTPLADFMRKEWGASEPLIEGWLDIGDIAVLYGQVNHGKTLEAAEFALAVGAGRPLFGRFPAVPARVLLVEEDCHPQKLQRYLQTLMDAYGLGEADVFVWERQFLRLDDEEAANAFIDEVLRLRPKLIILDAFLDLHSGDGFAGRELRPILDRIALLPQLLPCAVLVLDHTRKEAAGQKAVDPIDALYGGRMKAALADKMLLTVKTGDVPLQFDVSMPKTRDEPRAPIQVTFSREDGFSTEEPAATLSPSARAILDWARKRPVATIFVRRDIEQGTGLSARSVKGGVPELLYHGLLERVGKVGRADGYRLKTWQPVQRPTTLTSAAETTDCDHRPCGEAQRLWASVSPEDHPALCGCCGCPVGVEGAAESWDGTCRVCRDDRPHQVNASLRLADGPGARAVDGGLVRQGRPRGQTERERCNERCK